MGPFMTVPGASPSARNRAAATLPKNRYVALTAPTEPGEIAVTSLTAAVLNQGRGFIQEDCGVGRSVALHTAGIVEAESDGTATITAGRRVIAVPNATLADAGRVAEVPAAAGTYLVVGHALDSVGAVANAKLRVCACSPYPVTVA